MSLIFVTSCYNEELVNDNEELLVEENVDVLIPKIDLYKETALLFGKVMMNEQVRNAVNQKLREVDSYGELASLSYVLEVDKGLMKNEIATLKSNKSPNFKSENNVVLEALISEINNNEGDYGNLNVLLVDNSKGNSSKSDNLGTLADLLASEEMQIYFPFADLMKSSKDTSDEFYITFDPIVYTEKNEAFKYIVDSDRPQGFRLESIGDIDNKFLYANPVYVVGPIDDCDLPGSDCGYIDLEPLTKQFPIKCLHLQKHQHFGQVIKTIA